MRSSFGTALLVASAASVLAAPAPGQSIGLPKAVQRTPKFTAFGMAGTRPASLSKIADDRQAALAYIAGRAGVSVADLEVTDDYVGSNGLRHLYVERLVGGKRVSNQVANASIKDGKVFSFGSTIGGTPVNKTNFSGAARAINADAAQAAAEKAFGLVRNEIAPFQRLVETSENVVEPAWAVQVTSGKGQSLQWLEVDVSVSTGKILNAVSWVSHATYAHSRFESNDPRGSIITSTDPFLTRNSPKGWHSDGTTTFTESQGNNAYVYYGPDKKLTSGGPDNVYPVVYDFTKPANDVDNIKAGITNNFVITNLMHDLGVAYGFTEEAGNFQKVNLGGGGKGGDAVQVSVQDGGGFDNANFATPPDGQKPKMNMYVFRGTPTRDGTMENDIVEHEYGHGISNRLTGGPANSNCLSSAEAGGMGEGWSDYVYVATSRRKTHTRDDDVVIGAWAFDRPAGIRAFPYSTSMTRNTHTYSKLGTGSVEVHAAGNIWATMWNEVLWNLIDAKGIDEDIFNPPTTGSGPTAGNQIAIQLYFDSLAIQPCNPTFLSARDAVIQADAIRYAGAHKCLIWAGFAKRGLGVKAIDHKDDFSVPAECSGSTEPTTTVKPPASTTTTPTTTAEPTAKPPVTTTAKPPTSTTAKPPKPTKTPTPLPSPTNEPDEPWCPWWGWWC
ncbi:Fungalysin metallopeptidase-domain-containing protein [Geranomyces variabilis]|nr:Fungalysin metallopeptidase-domain-containing protein [Geranomyces variabilis]KAJ3131719.1 Fungalysin/Thermolysin Extracellular metalloproteinase 5 [Geranomyces variabilis]